MISETSGTRFSSSSPLPLCMSVHGLYKKFQKQSILRNVGFEIYEGELTAVVGRSGCGKSTLLRCLNGLEVFDQGSLQLGELHLEKRLQASASDLRYHDAVIHALRKNIGMVFQSFNLFPHLTILENLIKAPMVVKKMSLENAQALALPLLEKVGLADYCDRYPLQLSGGQQQRAGIARALAMQPKLMLYDEPTSALDPWLSEEVFQVMRKIADENLTQIVVTHDMRFVREFADKVIFLENGELVEMGTPSELLHNPKDARTRRFFKGDTN